MIRDLSLTLRELLTQPGLPAELAAAQIVFDRPADTFNPGATAVDLFLYDIRENTELRNSEPIINRVNGQALIRPAPMRVSCTYLVTAWPTGVGEEVTLGEHRLLSQVLQVLSGYSTIPAEFLQGSLAGQEPPLPMMAARVDSLKNPPEFWSAMGNKLRASFMVTVTIGMDVFETITAPVVLTETRKTTALVTATATKTSYRFGGRVTTPQNEPVVDAIVTLVETGQETRTDESGRYRLGRLLAGDYTVQVADPTLGVRALSMTVPAAEGSNYDVQFE